MTEPEETPPAIDDEFGKFPSHMNLVRNVFAFSYDEASKVTRRFQNNSDLMAALDQVLGFIAASDLPDEDKETVIDLLSEEKEVISFSVASRNSVVAI